MKDVVVMVGRVDLTTFASMSILPRELMLYLRRTPSEHLVNSFLIILQILFSWSTVMF